MNKDNEIKLVYDIVTHSAGFDVGITGILCIRQYEYPIWAVEYQAPLSAKIEVSEFSDALLAVKYFVDKRYELQLGLDFEHELMKEDNNV